jgi:hypothetical protein
MTPNQSVEITVIVSLQIRKSESLTSDQGITSSNPIGVVLLTAY